MIKLYMKKYPLYIIMAAKERELSLNAVMTVTTG